MRVLALLPDDSFRALGRALGPDDAVTLVATGGDIVGTVTREAPDAVVLDPGALTASAWNDVRPLVEAGLVPLLLYTRLTPSAVSRVLSASTAGAHEVVLRGVDDDPVTLRRLLRSVSRPAAPAQLLSRLASRLGRLPTPAQRVAIPLFCAAPVPRWGDEIARAARVPRRTLDRWFARAGFEGTATLLDVARLARVWTPIVEDRLSGSAVAARLGYGRLRNLSLHTRRLVGVRPSHLARLGSAREFAARLAQFAIRD